MWNKSWDRLKNHCFFFNTRSVSSFINITSITILHSRDNFSLAFIQRGNILRAFQCKWQLNPQSTKILFIFVSNMSNDDQQSQIHVTESPLFNVKIVFLLFYSQKMKVMHQGSFQIHCGNIGSLQKSGILCCRFFWCCLVAFLAFWLMKAAL